MTGAGPDFVRFFEDVAEGETIGPVLFGPMSVMHLVRWCGATENWHRIHYDDEFCRDHEGLPGPLINGSWKQQVLAQMFKEWAGSSGWLNRLKFSFRGMDVAGDTLTVRARVVARTDRGDYGEVRCDVEMINSSGEATTAGEATVFFPYRGGAALAYPVPSAMRSTKVDTTNRQPCPAEFQRYIGMTSDRLVSPDVVEAGAVRRFMQAIMADDTDYYAPSGLSRFGAVVAPPLYPLHAFHLAPGAPDPLERTKTQPDFDGAGQTAWSSFGLPELEGAPSRILNAGNDIEINSYAPLGCRVAVTSTYDDIYLKEGKQGPLLFVSALSRYSVHETGQPLVQSRQLIILR